MIAIMTVTGIDHVGIIAAVTSELARLGVNITDVSQTLMAGYFTMILQVTVDSEKLSIDDLQAAMQVIGEEQALEIRVQSDAIFRAMHRL